MYALQYLVVLQLLALASRWPLPSGAGEFYLSEHHELGVEFALYTWHSMI